TAIRGERDTAKGKSITWTIGTTLYRVPNLDVADQINTILKMSQKRALVAATLIVTGLSDHFTQDIEDYADQSYEPARTHAQTAETKTETTPPKSTDWTKLVSAAATIDAVREIAKQA